MSARQTSYPRNKIKILLLENISDAAVDELGAGGYADVERIKGALSEDELARVVKGVHLLGIRSKTQITKRVIDAADKLPSWLKPQFSKASTAKGMYGKAVEAYFRSSELNTTKPVDPILQSNLRRKYEIGGVESFWRGRIEMLTKPYQTGGYLLAKYHVRLGETEEAIHWLMRAREGRDFESIFFIADPVF